MLSSAVAANIELSWLKSEPVMGRGLALPITFVYCNPGREYSHVCIEQVTVNEILEELLSWRAEKMETQDKCESSVCRWPTPAIPALTGSQP